MGTDITRIIRDYMIYAPPQIAQKPPPDFLKAAVAQCVMGLSGLNIVIEDFSAKPNDPANSGGRYA
jgi:hypothetical protein